MRECQCGGSMEEVHIQALVKSKVSPYINAFTSTKTVVLWICMDCEKVKAEIENANTPKTQALENRQG